MADAECKGEVTGGAPSAAAAAGKDGSGGASGAPAIGIDLGTTYSCVAVSRNGRVEIIPNKQGERTTASCVAFTTDGRVLLGTPAKEQAESNPRNTGEAGGRWRAKGRSSCCTRNGLTAWLVLSCSCLLSFALAISRLSVSPVASVHDTKRLMGRAFADPLINDDKAHWQFDVIEGEKKMAAIRVQSSGESKTLAPEQIGYACACRRARAVRRASVCLFPDLASALSFASSFLFR